jgi:hypothetical protein
MVLLLFSKNLTLYCLPYSNLANFYLHYYVLFAMRYSDLFCRSTMARQSSWTSVKLEPKYFLNLFLKASMPLLVKMSL